MIAFKIVKAEDILFWIQILKEKVTLNIFDEFSKCCFNNEVEEAFFAYLMRIDTTNFNSQSFPLTQNKQDAIAKRLDPVYQFLKQAFIIEEEGIKTTVTEY